MQSWMQVLPCLSLASGKLTHSHSGLFCTLFGFTSPVKSTEVPSYKGGEPSH